MQEKYEISIRTSDFSSYTLNLTQQMFDIQKDKPSELQSKEQSPIVEKDEAFKGKTVDVSKGSIQRGVKERKRAEKNRDDSDFVYRKQTKKS